MNWKHRYLNTKLKFHLQIVYAISWETMLVLKVYKKWLISEEETKNYH